MPEYRGYFFYLGNSRGGSTFVEAKNEAEAKERYANVMYVEMEEYAKQGAEEDFTGPGTIRIEREPQAGEELDDSWSGEERGFEPFIRSTLPLDEDGMVNVEDAMDANYGQIDVVVAATPPEGYARTRWDDDAMALIFIPATQNKPLYSED